MPVRPPSPEREARLRELHAGGADDAEMARELGAVESTVARWRAGFGLAANPRAAKQAADTVAEVLRLRGEGLSLDAVARRLGVPKGQVAGIVRRAGAPGPAGRAAATRRGR